MATARCGSPPNFAVAVITINTTSGVMAKHDAWSGGFTTVDHGFYGMAFDGSSSMWLAPTDATAIVAINTTTGVMTKHDAWPAGLATTKRFYGIASDGNGKMWLAPYDANAIVAISTTTGVMTLYAAWPAGFTIDSSAFERLPPQVHRLLST